MERGSRQILSGAIFGANSFDVAYPGTEALSDADGNAISGWAIYATTSKHCHARGKLIVHAISVSNAHADTVARGMLALRGQWRFR